MSDTVERVIAEAVLSDITGRSGFSHVWDGCDDEIQTEIRVEIGRAALSALKSAGMVVLPREPNDAWLARYMKRMRLANKDNAKLHMRSVIAASEESNNG